MPGVTLLPLLALLFGFSLVDTMSGKGGKILTIVFVSVLSWYSGLKFWKPIVIEKLQEEGKLRTDIDINYDGDDTPASWDDLKTKIKIAMHPELKDKFEAEASGNSKLQQELKELSSEQKK